jgi:hypothetical protein
MYYFPVGMPSAFFGTPAVFVAGLLLGEVLPTLRGTSGSISGRFRVLARPGLNRPITRNETILGHTRTWGSTSSRPAGQRGFVVEQSVSHNPFNKKKMPLPYSHELRHIHIIFYFKDTSASGRLMIRTSMLLIISSTVYEVLKHGL